MPNFKDDILRRAGNEPIEAIVIQSYRESNYDHPDRWQEVQRPVHSWAQVAPLLDYEYDTGYGGVDCHTFVAWTATKVLFLGTYDGSTWIAAVPRNPTPCIPDPVGGG